MSDEHVEFLKDLGDVLSKHNARIELTGYEDIEIRPESHLIVDDKFVHNLIEPYKSRYW